LQSLVFRGERINGWQEKQLRRSQFPRVLGNTKDDGVVLLDEARQVVGMREIDVATPDPRRPFCIFV